MDTQQIEITLTITHEKHPNGSFDVYCSASMPDDCPPELVRTMATWDASPAYGEAVARAAKALLIDRKMGLQK